MAATKPFISSRNPRSFRPDPDVHLMLERARRDNRVLSLLINQGVRSRLVRLGYGERKNGNEVMA